MCIDRKPAGQLAIRFARLDRRRRREQRAVVWSAGARRTPSQDAVRELLENLPEAQNQRAVEIAGEALRVSTHVVVHRSPTVDAPLHELVHVVHHLLHSTHCALSTPTGSARRSARTWSDIASTKRSRKSSSTVWPPVIPPTKQGNSGPVSQRTGSEKGKSVAVVRAHLLWRSAATARAGGTVGVRRGTPARTVTQSS